MSIEAMKQALDALEAYGSHTSTCDYLMLLTSMPPQRKPCSCGLANAITALRAAIEQAEKQEPVSWMWADGTITTDPDRADGTWTPLYTAPRQWQGLTDEEIINVLHPLVMADLSDEATDYEIARAIETKLKEKNT